MRFAFSDRKIALHARGLGLTYALVVAAFYTVRALAGARMDDLWREFGLSAPLMLVAGDSSTLETAALAAALLVGWVSWVYWGTAVAKITIEQLRGDHFYAKQDALRLARRCSRGVLGTLVAVCLFALAIRVLAYLGGLIGRIPYVGEWWIAAGSLAVFPAFFAGLLLAILVLIAAAGVLMLPAIAGSTGARGPEVSYQLTVIVWSGGWRLLAYELVALVTAAPAAGALIAVGWGGLHAVLGGVVQGDPQYLEVLRKASGIAWGGAWQPVGPWVGIASAPGGLSTALAIASVVTAVGFVAVTITIASYVLTVTTVGNVLIYANLRRRIWGDNVFMSDGDQHGQVAPVGDGDGDPQADSGEGNARGSQRVMDDA